MGRLLSRRRALALLGAGSVVACTGQTDTGLPPGTDEDDTEDGGTSEVDTERDTDALDCGPRTGAQTEGPFYPGEPAERMDIRGGVDGVVIHLDLQVVTEDTCEPVVGAEVDVWGADADGDYSGYARFDTVGQDFQRGQQVTDSEGRVRFTAIVPGSYPGRAVHLHVKVRGTDERELTTQVYLPDALVQGILEDPRYADGAPHTLNAGDGFYAPDTLLDATGTASDGIVARGVLVV